MTLLRSLVSAGMLSAGLAAAAVAAPPADHPAVRKAIGLLKAHAAATAHAADSDYAPQDVLLDADGTEHVRLERSYRGLPVIGGDLVVHSDARGFRGASHTLRQPLQLDTAPTFDDRDAIRVAQGLFDATPTAQPRSALVVYARGEQPQLAWDVLLTGERSDGTPSETHFIVSAHAAQLLDRWDDVKHADVVGSGRSLLSGTVGLRTNSLSSGGFELRDLPRKHATYDARNAQTTAQGSIVTDADGTWGNYATSDRATVAADAAFGYARTWDYFGTLGRKGIDGSGTRASYSRVHYGSRYANAFWSDSCFCMTYGDGDGVNLLPLVSVDIAGHEMTHGVTSQTARLVYSGESGGLNEATSDIFGTMVEYHAANAAVASTTPNYLVGERIFAASYKQATPTRAVRYMFKPSLDGRSPDCYASGLGAMDVHYSSGVANHFFYLLAEGARVPNGFNLTPSQLVCNGNTALTGIGRAAAARIYYRALAVYMTSNTNYAGARVATLRAAADLYGSGSVAHRAVAAAWSAVRVN